MATEKQLINYLQAQMDSYKKSERERGFYNFETKKLLDGLIVCKEIIENLIKKPVNLGLDGKITVGLHFQKH